VADVETGEVHEVYSVARDVLGPPTVSVQGSEVTYSRRVTEGDLWVATIRDEG
jgi:hypothetical protein